MTTIRELLGDHPYLVPSLELYEAKYRTYSDGIEWAPELGEWERAQDFDTVDSLDNATHVVFPYTVWGDYVGDLYTRANYDYLTTHNAGDVIDVRYPFDSYSVVLPLDHDYDTDETDILDLFLGIFDYPCIDDDTWEIEESIFQSDWDNWLRVDFRDAVADAIGCDTLDLEDLGADDDTLLSLAHETESARDYQFYVVETAVSGYIVDMDRVASEVADAIMSEYVNGTYIIPGQGELTL